MDYTGPHAADFAEVTALNHAFLVRLRSPCAAGAHLRNQLPEQLHPVITGLRDVQVERLATSPFLLLSLRERDAGFWQRLAIDHASPDLFSAEDENTDEIAAAALSFLWHLARRNPYAARLVAGAGNDWCSFLTNTTLLTLLRRASGRRNLLHPRLANNRTFWTKLLGPGLDSSTEVRVSAQTACLQTMLTDVPDPAPQYRAAARRSEQPRYRSRPAHRSR